MRSKRTIALVMVFLLQGVLCWGDFQEKKVDEKQGKEAQKSLIRKDLLMAKKDASQRPRRNIFSPRGIAINQEDVATLISPREIEEQGAMSDEGTSFYDLSVRYIGYVDTGKRIVALIIFEGEAMAVEEGEMITERFKVDRVTRDKLSIIGPGDEIKEFPLEGE